MKNGREHERECGEKGQGDGTELGSGDRTLDVRKNRRQGEDIVQKHQEEDFFSYYRLRSETQRIIHSNKRKLVGTTVRASWSF